MPRITKDAKKEIDKKAKDAQKEKKTTKTSSIVKKSTTKNTTTKKEKQEKKPVKKSTKTNAVAKEKNTKVAKATTSTTKSNTKKKTTKSSSKKTVQKNIISIMEYYDLPYRYSQTIVKILAQTPKMLFVYWDISDEDRKAFENHYGDDFFSKTKPVLIVHNETMNYSFEIEINDFANSWYLHIQDANCKYVIELGRRPLPHTSNIQDNYIYISSSNKIDAPNNHILFEKFNPNVVYKNTKSGTTYTKNFSTLSNFKNMQKIYNIYDLYKKIFKDELFSEVIQEPANPSSIFKRNLHKGEK